MELTFTPRTVKEIEQKTRKSIVEVAGNMSLTNIAILVEKGATCSEDDALNKIQEYMSEDGKDLSTLYIDIAKQLQDLGFLPSSLDLDFAKEAMTNKETAERVMNSSMNTGL